METRPSAPCGPVSRILKALADTGWAAQFFATLMFSGLMLGFFWYLYQGNEVTFGRATPIGTVMHAYGTVKKARMPVTEFASTQRRLESGKELRETIHLGEQIQTGEDSAAELLFYGGTTLQLASGTIVRFEEEGDEIALRLMMGRAFLEILPGAGSNAGFVFRQTDGKELDAPEDRSLLLTLNAAQGLAESVDVRSVETIGTQEATEKNLRYLAHGEELNHGHRMLIPPVEDRGRRAPAALERSTLDAPTPVYPPNDADVAVENLENAFHWKPALEGKVDSDPVIGYELSIRPAFGYGADDGARKHQIFRTDEPKLPVARVGGGGVFLWSVREVTQGGKRGPASGSRWVELRFPRMLLAPEVMKPKVE